MISCLPVYNYTIYFFAAFVLADSLLVRIQPSLSDRFLISWKHNVLFSIYFDFRSSDFVNQLVATAVSAAGQAYITTKAVFKTWQEKKVGTLYGLR